MKRQVVDGYMVMDALNNFFLWVMFKMYALKMEGDGYISFIIYKF